MEEWQEAFDTLQQCLNELENAMNMRNLKRIRECRKWTNEAAAREREAYKEAIASME